MNEQERLEILQQLSSGEISAEKAAQLLSGQSAKDDQFEPVAIEEEIDSSNEQHAEVQVEIIEELSQKKASQLRISAVNDAGNLDIDIVIPVPLLKLGRQIGDRFAPVLDGWDWRALDLDINLDALHVRVSAE